MSTATKTAEEEKLTHAVGSLNVRSTTVPLKRNHSLDKWKHFEHNPPIGHEFDSDFQLSEIVHASNADDLIKDLAILISQRGVVFFRAQNLNVDDQKILGTKLGELSGKPIASTLHVHPTTEAESPKGDQISIITSERRSEYYRGDRSRLASTLWHSDITFEPVPSDYAILKIHTNPPAGGDTLWASAYELYSRLSPPIAKLLEGREAIHEATHFKQAVAEYGNDLRTGERGHPDNQGDSLTAVHPVIRVNPVTGWKGLFVNKGFTKRIIGLTKDESDVLLDYLFRLTSENHDAQVRFKWATHNAPGIGDIAIWDNRSTIHTATYDYFNDLRVGDRVVSIGEKPYYDVNGVERRVALGLPSFHQER